MRDETEVLNLKHMIALSSIMNCLISPSSTRLLGERKAK